MTTNLLPPAIEETIREYVDNAHEDGESITVSGLLIVLAPVWESAVREQVDAAGLAGWLGGDNKIMSWLARHDQELREAVGQEMAEVANKMKIAAGENLASAHDADSAVQYDTAMEIEEAIRALTTARKQPGETK
jgi:GTP cyclohydrolase III